MAGDQIVIPLQSLFDYAYGMSVTFSSPFLYRPTLAGFLTYASFRTAITVLLAALFVVPAQARPLTIEDVLKIVSIDRADIAPHSEEIAISVQRSAASGEVYGRNSYEIDPSRNDVWLVSGDGSTRRNLTNGQSRAAGFWCPYWSPNGRYLAMLSTNPEGDEPHGGDNVRLYVWDRETDDLRRASERAMMTQTRYGSPLNELDLRESGARKPNTCRENDENAPFLWVGNNRLLAVMMPPGQNSAMVDRYAKFHREAAQAGEDIRAGEIAIVSRSDSGAAAPADTGERFYGELVLIDLAAGSQESLGRIPAFPMFGALTIALSPDEKRAAILAPSRAIPPHMRSKVLSPYVDWSVEKALGLLVLDDPTSLRWITLPQGARYPVDLIGWAPDSGAAVLRARGDAASLRGGLWIMLADTGEMTRLADGMSFGMSQPAHQSGSPYAYWADSERMIVYGLAGNGEESWQTVPVDGSSEQPFSSGYQDFSGLRQLRNGALIGSSEAGPVRFDASEGRFIPHTPDEEAGDCALAPQMPVPDNAEILDRNCIGTLWQIQGRQGTSISFAAREAPNEHTVVMDRNRHLAQIAWGERRMVEYTDARGDALKMAVMFPPDYDPQRRYPTLIWVYGGYSPHSVDSFFFDPHMSGPYNLQLYASQGYVVVVPSIPIPRSDEPSEPMRHIIGGVIPAIDRLVEMGITDNGRVGVFGQSYGGYTVFALVAQSDRFAAAAGLAGITELATSYGAFDPTARGYLGIEQDMSASPVIYESAHNLRRNPGEDPALYQRNSPLTYADHIDTPLLVIHGELDMRTALNQPEALYSLLHRRGKTARLLRYWGENHSLANSPANVRDITGELMDWFDRFVKCKGGETGSISECDGA